MRLRCRMLLICVFLLAINQKCFSMEDEAHNKMGGEALFSAGLRSTPLAVRVYSPYNDIGLNSTWVKFIIKNTPLVLSKINPETNSQCTQNEKEDQDLTYGFPTPLDGQVISCVIQPFYTLLFFPSIDQATHPNIIEMNDLDPIILSNVTNKMKFVQKELNYWGEKFNKKEQGKALYIQMLENAQEAKSVKIGVKQDQHFCALLIENKRGQFLFLAVPGLRSH